MATLSKRLDLNVPGSFFVDSTCIDCSTCNWMAPETFKGSTSYSYVHTQPNADKDIQRALQALTSCPVGAIGCDTPKLAGEAADTFPDLVEDDVYHCGFHSEASFGATSYFIRRPTGNILVDSPRFARRLVNRLEEWGGIDLMYLTHRDDIADHHKFADHFGCDRIIHEDDAVGSIREAERILRGTGPISLEEDLLVLPVPGHTKGSACLLYRNTFLFTGDHLAWNADAQNLRAFRTACWYDWETQITSMETLQDHSFEWVLPGHGRRVNLPEKDMKRSLNNCIDWMKNG